jgi:site-specific DNA recombinase
MATQLRNVPGARFDSERHALHTPTRSRAALTLRVPIVGKAAIYTRVSTDKQQDGASLDVQLDACRNYCESNGLIVVAEFRDVLSGLKTDRPQYRQAVDLARSKSVDKLVVWRLDRLGRDSGEYITQLRDLRKLGISVSSVTQPGESVLMQELMGVLAAEESRQLSVRITASKRRRAAEGKWSGGFAPMGYDIERHPDGGCVLVPNDDAPLIREMFKRYATGRHNLRNLRDFMNERGHIITKQSLLNILKNPAYMGVVRQGHFSRSTLIAGPKEVRQAKGLHKALVDEATFEKVQAKRKANRSRANGGTAPKFLFSGLTFCGGCGGRYTASWTGRDRSKGHIYYFCNRSRDAGDCKAHGLKESVIREAVLPPLERLLQRLHKKDMRRMVRDELRLQQSALDASAGVERAKLELQQTKAGDRLTRLEDLYLDGGLSRARYVERRDALEREAQEIATKLAERPKLSELDVNSLVSAADALDGESLDDQEWRDIVAEMVDRIVITSKGISVVWREAYRPLLTT